MVTRNSRTYPATVCIYCQATPRHDRSCECMTHTRSILMFVGQKTPSFYIGKLGVCRVERSLGKSEIVENFLCGVERVKGHSHVELTRDDGGKVTSECL